MSNDSPERKAYDELLLATVREAKGSFDGLRNDMNAFRAEHHASMLAVTNRITAIETSAKVWAVVSSFIVSAIMSIVVGLVLAYVKSQ